MTKYLATAVMVLLTVGCGDSASLTPTGPIVNTLTQAPLPSEASSETQRVAPIPGPYSCPSEAPGRFSVNTTGGDASALFRWAQVGNVQDYQIEVERLGVLNSYVPAALIQSDGQGLSNSGLVFHAWRIPSDGRYRARIRSVTRCGTTGNWSAYATFERAVGDVPLPEEPQPPICPATFGHCWPID